MVERLNREGKISTLTVALFNIISLISYGRPWWQYITHVGGFLVMFILFTFNRSILLHKIGFFIVGCGMLFFGDNANAGAISYICFMVSLSKSLKESIYIFVFAGFVVLVKGKIMKLETSETIVMMMGSVITARYYFIVNGTYKKDVKIYSSCEDIDIIKMHSSGMNPKEIAASLGVTANAINKRINRYKTKCGYDNLPELIRDMTKKGIL